MIYSKLAKKGYKKTQTPLLNSKQLWVPDETLEREVAQHYARAIASYQANPHLVSEHANHEESIRVGGYADRTLLELVQNAADADIAPTEIYTHVTTDRLRRTVETAHPLAKR